MTRKELAWQSKLVLLLVLPFVGADLVLDTHWWAAAEPSVTVWTLGLSVLLGLITWKLRAATPAAALAGAAITAQLMFSTAQYPYEPWHTALIPVLAVSLLAFVSTRIGRGEKEQLGSAEDRTGRSAAQVAANLGVAAIAAGDIATTWMTNRHKLAHAIAVPFLAVSLAALAEAAADTVSSEIGQVLGGSPRMITTLRKVETGIDGAVSLAGTFAGILAGATVAALGSWALRGSLTLFTVSCAGSIFGLFFDSVLGATLERCGWLNNDMVNFLSTASAAGFALASLAIVR